MNLLCLTFWIKLASIFLYLQITLCNHYNISSRINSYIFVRKKTPWPKSERVGFGFYEKNFIG
nr:MAG TPA: hypothetical protein [Caudoviricetes sp.]